MGMMQEPQREKLVEIDLKDGGCCIMLCVLSALISIFV